jgi:hypothetical protein
MDNIQNCDCYVSLQLTDSMFRDAERYTTHEKGAVGEDFIITK